MNIRSIRELARIMRENGLTAMDITEGETHIRMECAQGGAPLPAAAAPCAPQPQPEPLPDGGDPGMDFSDVSLVASPMVGVFYAAPAPGEPPFVKVGSRVKKGDVLCILEAMKLMNEITAEQDGEIVDVCANDGDVVEFGQTLFKVYEK